MVARVRLFPMDIEPPRGGALLTARQALEGGFIDEVAERPPKGWREVLTS